MWQSAGALAGGLIFTLQSPGAREGPDCRLGTGRPAAACPARGFRRDGIAWAFDAQMAAFRGETKAAQARGAFDFWLKIEAAEGQRRMPVLYAPNPFQHDTPRNHTPSAPRPRPLPGAGCGHRVRRRILPEDQPGGGRRVPEESILAARVARRIAAKTPRDLRAPKCARWRGEQRQTINQKTNSPPRAEFEKGSHEQPQEARTPA